MLLSQVEIQRITDTKNNIMNSLLYMYSAKFFLVHSIDVSLKLPVFGGAVRFARFILFCVCCGF
jgi:hypothetical protein